MLMVPVGILMLIFREGYNLSGFETGGSLVKLNGLP